MFENLQFVIFKGVWTYRLSIESTSQGFLWWEDWGNYHDFLPLHQGLVSPQKIPENNKENNSLLLKSLISPPPRENPASLSLFIQSRRNNSI